MIDYFNNVRHDIIDLIPKGEYGCALEIGGGEFGTILKIRELYGTTAWGVDVRSTEAALDCFLHGSIMDHYINSRILDNSVGLIVANDVIEHIVDTEAFLEICRRKLEKGGIIALSVPNARQLRLFYHVMLRGAFPRNESGLFDRTHVRWFCKRDVTALLGNAGFEVVEARSVGRLVPRFMSRLMIAELLALQNIFLARAV